MARLSAYTSPEEVCTDLGFPMSRAYVLTANSAAAQKKVYVGANYVSHFPIGCQVLMSTGNALTDAAGGPMARVPYIMEYGIVSALGADYIELTANLANSFNTASFAEVNMVSKYTNATRPSWTDIDKKIQNVEDRIDYITHTTWKQRAEVEFHSFNPAVRRVGFSLSGRGGLWWDRDSEYAVYLQHRPVKTLATTADTAYTGYLGDSIIVWYGTQMKEIFSAANPYGADVVGLWTYGRNSDYWLDYENGILMFNNNTPNFSVRAIKITYRYGNTLRAATNAAGFGDIQEAAKLLVKIAILQDRRFMVDFPGGNDALQLQQAITSMKNDAEHILARHIEHLVGYDKH